MYFILYPPLVILDQKCKQNVQNDKMYDLNIRNEILLLHLSVFRHVVYINMNFLDPTKSTLLGFKLFSF